MKLHETKASWNNERDNVLTSLGTAPKRAFPNAVFPQYAGQSINRINASVITQNARQRLAVKALRTGQFVKFVSVTVLAKTAKLNAKIAIKVANTLRDSGYFDLALLYFGQAAKGARTQSECTQTIFKMGHCAKVAGHYGLAAECFAFTSQFSSGEDRVTYQSRDDLAGALHSLTNAFSSRPRRRQ